MNKATDKPPHSSTLPSVANFSDALGGLGLKFQTMHSRIRPVFTPIFLSGRAFTVRCYPGATHAVEAAIEAADPGDVLVIDGAAFGEAVLMGGLMSARARVRGIAGAVIDGAVRDTVELRQAQWPMFSAAITPRAGTHDQLGDHGSAVSCGEIVVHPGDWIVADEDGVVAIPADRHDEVLVKAREIETKETFIAKAIERGSSLSEAVAAYRENS